LPSEALLRGLEEEGVVVSAGAACHARSQKQSHVLEALGLPGSSGTARFSFGEETTPQDMARAVEALARTVERYRL
ncbi:MAG: cysteine desulfurase NifS, partial [Polyangia bacterium]|nr:cysteine desulfurase NifS [Polyangia bacterium]